MNIDFFKKNLKKYADAYDRESLFDTLKRVAKKVGIKVVYMVLLLYYATLDKDIPIKDRMLVVAALGYFILPLDFIPDAFPGGFADDTAAILFVLKQVWHNLTPATRSKARQRLGEWFGEVTDEDVFIPGL